MAASPRWTPLESNPDSFNKFMRKLGIPDQWNAVDIFGFDPELLSFIPQPIAAVIFTFPDMEEYEEMVRKKYEAMSDEERKGPSDCFFMHQHINMACGTYALLHALANSPIIDKGSGVFGEFYERAKDASSPEERSKLLEQDTSLARVHETVAQEGQTPPESDVRHHFICFLPKDGFLWEFDGTYRYPRKLRSTSDSSFLTDISEICKEIISFGKDGNLTFSAMAIVGSTFD